MEREEELMKVYVAGSLFNEAEVAQRKKEGQLLRERFPSLDILIPLISHLMKIKHHCLHHRKFMKQIQKQWKNVMYLLRI